MPTSYVDIDRAEMEYVDGGATCTITIQRAWLVSVGIGAVVGAITGAVVGALGGNVVAVQAGRVVGAFVAGVASYMIQNKSTWYTFSFWIPGSRDFKKRFGY